VEQTTPSLAEAARASGLAVTRYPLLVLDGELSNAEMPERVRIRLVSAEDVDFARVHAVASVGFRASGTNVGEAGGVERDAEGKATPPATLDFLGQRQRSGLSITAAAFDAEGPLAVGTHQPVGAVTEIVGVATLPSARRQGLGAAVTAALVADARARGITTIFLSAGSDDVARVYERIGFRRIGFAGSAELP
jgi:predicted GNAT family acetyltransferase